MIVFRLRFNVVTTDLIFHLLTQARGCRIASLLATFHSPELPILKRREGPENLYPRWK